MSCNDEILDEGKINEIQALFLLSIPAKNHYHKKRKGLIKLI